MRKSRGKISRKTRTGPRGQKLWFNQSGDTVTLWQNYGQEGESFSLGEGTHLGGTDFTNDDVSSIDVPAGMRAVLHQHSRTDSAFNADDALTIDGPATQNLTDFNDQLSEIDVENMPMPDSDMQQAEAIETFLYDSKLTDFDWFCYADRYEDLKEAFGYDTVALKDHFVTYGYNEGRDPSCGDDGYSLPDSDLLTYAQDTWGLNEEQSQELLDYAYTKVLPNESWMQGEQQKANDKGRPLSQQVIHASHYQLYSKDGCKYCSNTGTGGMSEQRAGFFSGTTGMILIGVAVLGVGYMIYKRNRQN